MTAAGPRKPLYLDGRAQAIEVRAFGPALAVARGAHRFSLPLARLSRVVACGRVNWDNAALALCLQSRVSIVFVDGRARPLGAAVPITGHTSNLDELLSEWVDDAHWRPHYDNWLRAQRLRVLRLWRHRRAETPRPIGTGEWSEAVRTFVYRDDPEFAGPCAGGCYALVLAVLLRVGVRTRYRTCDGGVLDLAADLGRIVNVSVTLDLGTLAAKCEAEHQLTVRAAEVGAAEVEALIVGLLQRLRRCIGDWIEPWP